MGARAEYGGLDSFSKKSCERVGDCSGVRGSWPLSELHRVFAQPVDKQRPRADRLHADPVRATSAEDIEGYPRGPAKTMLH